jgi:hypothetical protein
MEEILRSCFLIGGGEYMADEGRGKRIAISGGFCLVIVLGVLGLFRDPIALGYYGRAFPDPRLRELGTLAFAAGEASVPAGQVPYRTGKVLIVNPPVTGADVGGRRADIDIQAAKIDRDWVRLPSAVRAATPDEVATVIVCRRRVGPVGVYAPKNATQEEIAKIAWGGSSRDQGHQYSAELTVFDVKSRLRVGSYAILGPAPPAERSGREDGEPADVAEFVRRMPSR